MWLTLINDSTFEVKKIQEGKSRIWFAVFYPEILIDDWEDKISMLLQIYGYMEENNNGFNAD